MTIFRLLTIILLTIIFKGTEFQFTTIIHMSKLSLEYNNILIVIFCLFLFIELKRNLNLFYHFLFWLLITQAFVVLNFIYFNSFFVEISSVKDFVYVSRFINIEVLYSLDYKQRFAYTYYKLVLLTIHDPLLRETIAKIVFDLKDDIPLLNLNLDLIKLYITNQIHVAILVYINEQTLFSYTNNISDVKNSYTILKSLYHFIFNLSATLMTMKIFLPFQYTLRYILKEPKSYPYRIAHSFMASIYKVAKKDPSIINDLIVMIIIFLGFK